MNNGIDWKVIEEIKNYVKENWLLCVHRAGENEAVLPMPYPFSSPSHEGQFSNFFYWDTYFINNGLLRDGFSEQAKNNILNICFLIDRFGFMPNVAVTGGSSRSQLPLFIQMVDEYYEATGNFELLEYCFPRMVKEYDFWMKNRSLENGLNCFGDNCEDEESYRVFYELVYFPRVCIKNPERKKLEDNEIVYAGSQALGEAESGWDFTPRFEGEIKSCAAVDLNSLMYANELKLQKFCELLGIEGDYAKRAEQRKKIFMKCCFDGTYFRDHNVRTKKFVPLVTAASFFPYAFGIASDKHGIIAMLEKLEFEYGISTTEKNESEELYQWNYPNLWPPLQFFAVKAMLAVGMEEDAKRCAEKYITDVAAEFIRTGYIWEKYEVLHGRKAEMNEYRDESMMGWSAATFTYFYDCLKKEKNSAPNGEEK